MRVKLCDRCPYVPQDLVTHCDTCAALHPCAGCDGETAISAIQSAREIRRKRTDNGTRERTMCDKSEQSERRPSDQSCAVCSRQFGLIRYYSWRTAVCSKKCLDRFRARSERDRRWLFRARVA
ncbi:hypothetical protein [Bradyrhizobium sp. Ec3.3]|uniref:hypothetical protein n=1 Tax=Bradyrhizobium sp. Ec3.3 TaxID=189753 RepID=UPI001FD9B256|nr:hypothetical protein [Bradyrhizobium sp. Ec3.3]